MMSIESGEAQAGERDVREYLSSELEGVRCDLLRFPGNYGDAVIWHGTREILAEARVDYRTIQCSGAPTRDVLIVDGGGNLVDLYDDVRLFLDSFSDRYSRIIILPHTIVGGDSLSLLRRLSEKVVVFCRECVSYKAVRSAAPSAEAFLWHDCGFFAPIVKKHCDLSPAKASLTVYRTDREASATRGALPCGNRDLSLEGYPFWI